jgi:xanthine dehydrogenase YagR molybdenum-binding subunit
MQTLPTSSPIGRATPRIDGPAKVSGLAKYTADCRFPGMLYAVPVEATIANGRIAAIGTSVAEKMPNVRAIFHRQNIGKIVRSDAGKEGDRICEERRPPLEDDIIRYYGQYVALAVADTFEAAKAAADAVRVSYDREMPNVARQLAPDDYPDEFVTTFAKLKRLQSERGDFDAAFKKAPVKVDQVYVTPAETHNPMELHATVAVWEGSKLTIYESSQGICNLRNVLAQMFELPKENVRVISRFIGSGFGNKLFPWTHCPLAVAAARQLGRPIKLVLTRKMMFQSAGHRARTQQRVRLGADREGKLLSLQHDYVYTRSMLDVHHEDCGEATPFMYSVPNLRVKFGRAKRNIGATADMRGPGAVPGIYALESAMNELAYELKMDPVRLRMLNEPEIDESQGIPFSSRHLLECLELGAERFGWWQRNPAIGSMQRDGLICGWGMGSCVWLAERFAAQVGVQIRDDGTVSVACATQDIGTGTYTILAQLVAEKFGLPIDKVTVLLGDTALPDGPLSGGSMTTGSVVPAVFEAADQAIQSLLEIAATTPGSPFEKHKVNDLAFADGKIVDKTGTLSNGIAPAELLRKLKLSFVGGHGKAAATFGEKNRKYSTHSFGCHFAEVTWQPEIVRLRVSRVVTVIDAGKVINPLAGRNQIEGAVVMGIGMALLEHTTYDPQNGAPINSNFADYIVAVNADTPPIEVHFLDHPDKVINEVGARGIGEIGLTGIAAAITDAVHHATGICVRELPVKIENLLA